MNLTMINVESPLLPLLGVGAENARTARELGGILDWRGEEVRREINRLRKAGVPVCASCFGSRGYYLPSCNAEAKVYGRQFRARLADAEKACAVFAQFEDYTGKSNVATGQGDYK